jgi:hypothetical protein
VTLALQFEVLSAPLERAEADLLLAGFFASDRPLRGGAGRADWRLCGLISQLVQEGRIQGEEGQAALLPAGPVFASPRLLLVGCGDSQGFDRVALRRVAALGLARAAALAVNSVAVALPLGGSVGSLSLDSSTLAVVEGAIDGGVPLPVVRLLVAPGTESGIAGMIQRYGQGHRAATIEVAVGTTRDEPPASEAPRAPDTPDSGARLSGA